MKQIPVGNKGLFTLVDEGDYEYLNQFKWTCSNLYVRRVIVKDGKKTGLRMNREIMEIQDVKIFVDHKDGNPLNNQRSNLRICTPAQNARNRRSHINSASKYLGVTIDNRFKKGVKYRARIMFNGKMINIGNFKDEIDAALAYDKSAVFYFGEFARVNIK